MSSTPSGPAGNSDSEAPTLSGDGRTAAFRSVAADLVSTDTTTDRDVFARGLVAVSTGGMRDIIRAASETYGANAARRNQYPAQGCACDPVDTLTGNFNLVLPGLAVGGRGPGLDFSVGYNSLAAATSGSTGYGWSNTLGMRLVAASDGSRTVVQETGATVRFIADGAGGWSVPPRFSASLVTNGDGTFTFTRAHLTTFRFSAAGLLLSASDLNGNTTSLTYPAGSTKASRIEDAGGRHLAITWTGDRITSVTDQLGAPIGPRTVTFGYDGAGNLVDYKDSTNGHWIMTYDGAHRGLIVRRPRHADVAKVLENHYDSAGRVDWQEDELNRRTTIAYDSPAGSTTLTRPGGTVQVDRFVDGLRVQTTEGAGTADAQTRTYGYDSATFALTSVTDGLSKVTTLGHDAAGNITSAEDPTGRITRWTYNGFDQITTEAVGERRTSATTTSTASVVTSSQAFDGAGRLLSATAAVGTADESITQYVHGTPAHPEDVTSIVDPRGKTWTFTYDAATGDKVSATEPGSPTRTTTWSYNAIGWPLTQTTPKGNASATVGDFMTTYGYDITNRTTTVTGPAGDISRQVLDANGNLASSATGITSAKPAGDVTLYQYTDADELWKVDPPGAGAKEFSYWPAGQRKRFTNELGNHWDYTYDQAGRLLTEADPEGAVTTYLHDATGRLSAVQQPIAGSTCSGTKVGCISYNYDDAGRPTSVDYSGTAPDVTGITYDDLGRRTSSVSSGVTELWSWDRLSRLTSRRDANARTTGYGYDDAGNLTSITYPGQTTPVVRAFDDASRLSSVTDWLGNTTTFGYDLNGNRTDTAFPASSTNTDQLGYDAADRLTSVTWKQGSATLGSESYGRSLAAKGMVSSSTATGSAGTATSAVTYDARRRLAGVGPQGFTFDAASNLVERADGSLQVFDPAQRLCWTSATASSGTCASTLPSDASAYTYDASGNRNSEATADNEARLLGYDQANRLTIVGEAGPLAPTSAMDGKALAGDYDGDGATDVHWYRAGAGVDHLWWGADRDRFGEPAGTFNVGGTYRPVVGDFDGDEHDDEFFYGVGSTADSIWFWNARHGTEYSIRSFTVGGDYTPLVGDFDGDGFDDLYWYTPGAGADYLWFGNNDVDGTTPFTSISASQSGTFDPVVGDFDGNGSSDIFWYAPGSGADAVWFGTSSRNSWVSRSQSVSGTYEAATGDFDHDGKDDVAFASASAGDTIWWGASTTAFGTLQKTVTITGSLQPFAGDFDGDGTDDLFLYDPGAGADTVWWGTSRAGFGTDAAQIGLDPEAGDGSTYRYDAGGLRSGKTVNGTVTTFTWSDGGPLPQLLGEHTGSSSTWILYGPGGQPFEQIGPGGSVSWLHADQVGSIRLTTDASGAVRSSRTWDAYGNVKASSGPVPILGYAGQYLDVETGYQYLRARYYDPATGQFLTADPLLAASMEPYGYAAGNPVNFSDPTGLIGLPFKIPEVVPVIGGSDCIRVGDDDCERNPKNQEGADFAGGVLDTVSGGNADRITQVAGVEDRWDPNSIAAHTGRAAGYTVAIINPAGFTTITSPLAWANAVDTTQACLRGQGGEMCGIDVAFSIASAYLPGAVGGKAKGFALRGGLSAAGAGEIGVTIYLFGGILFTSAESMYDIINCLRTST